MRRWLLVFLILLLPLRGWVGDAMAAQMLQQSVHAAAQPAAEANAHPGHDCDHQGTDANEVQAAQPAPGHDCPTCASCQVCSAVALWPPLLTVASTPLHQQAPEAAPTSFTSAEPALAFKPPRG